jgi:antitoxin component of RelBE/YafQ-DinJ toxin-antitoxin module
MLTDAVLEFFGVARSVAAASCNALRQPHATRCAAVRVHDDRKRVSLYVAEVVAPPLLRNIAETGRLAVQLSNPADHRTLQIKGRTLRSGLAPEADRAFVESFVEQLAHVVDELGISYERVVRMTCWPAIVVELDVEEIYLQTPGPGAGAPLGARSP